LLQNTAIFDIMGEKLLRFKLEENRLSFESGQIQIDLLVVFKFLRIQSFLKQKPKSGSSLSVLYTSTSKLKNVIFGGKYVIFRLIAQLEAFCNNSSLLYLILQLTSVK